MTQRKIHRIARRSPVLYVSSITGSDANDGRSPDKAKLTLAAAIAALPSASGTIRVSAPSTNPVNGFIQFSSGKIMLEGVNGVPWYTERTTTWASGWTDEGSSIYSRSDGGGDADIMFVPTQIDGNGFGRMLSKNLSTPTTPAQGQFGRTGGKFYVHLVGDENPNSHTLKRHNTGYLFRASGTSHVTIRDCVARYTGGNGIFENNAPAAILVLERCAGQYSASAGVSIPNGGGTVYCDHCTMQRHSNDGYNQHSGALMLINCDGSYNDDEGASNHNGSSMSISGGRFHHNAAGGCTVVNSGSKMRLTNVTVDFNGAKNGGGIEKNGINFDSGTSGSVANCTAQNNVGSGYYCNGASVAIINLTSGLEQGNTLADVTC